MLALEARGVPFEEVAHLVKGVRGKEGLDKGDVDHGIWSAGMVQGLIRDVPSVAELVERTVREAEEIIAARLGRMLARPAEARAA